MHAPNYLRIIIVLFALLSMSCSPKKATGPEPIPDPVAKFSWTGLFDAPASVTFLNHSTNAESFLWTFDDGYTSTLISPMHIFETPATYQVRLIAFSDDSTRSDTTIKAIIIFPPPPPPTPHADFSWTGAAVTSGSISFQNNSENADTYHWDFGDGRSSNFAYPRIVYQNQGTYTITLIASSTLYAPPDTARKTLKITPRSLFLDSLIIESVDFVDAEGNPWDADNGPDIFINIRKPNTVMLWTSIGDRRDNVESDSLPVFWDIPDTLEITDWSASYGLELYDYDRVDADDAMRVVSLKFSDLISRSGYNENYLLTSGQFRVRVAVIWK